MFRSRSVALFLAGCLIIPLLLVACGGSASSTTADAPDPAAVTRTAPTETPQGNSSPTVPPEATSTPESSATPSPPATNTTEPSPTASPTLEPTATSTPEEQEPAAIDAGQIEATLNGLLAETDGYVAVSVKTADGQILYEHDSDESMEAASIYKLPVMVEVYRQIEAGDLDLSTGVLLTPSFFNEGEDSIGWDSVNSYYDIETLLFAMIAQSSNVAAYALLDLVGNDNVNATMADMGLDRIEIRWSPRYISPEDLFPEPEDEYFDEAPPDYEDEYVEEPEPELPEEETEGDEIDPVEEDEVPEEEPTIDPDADDSGRGVATFLSLPAVDHFPTLRAEAAFNVITARAIADLLLLIVNGEAVSPGASEQMLSLLQQQQIPGGLPAQVPEGVVAHKTGYLEDGVFNDAGIVQTGLGPIIVVVLTEDVSEDIAYQIMSEAGRLVYELGTAD